MKELWKILWEDSGWAALTMGERIKAIYFCLSLFVCIVLAEAPFLWLLVAVANLVVSVKAVKTIKTKIPDE